MGRPVKQTVDYFPHFVNDSKTIYVLEETWGNDGYSFWFRLLEMLSKTDGHSIRLSEPIEWSFFVSRMKVKEEAAKDMLSLLTTIGKIDKDLWEKEKIIWCQNLVDNLATVYEKRTVSAPKKPKIEGFQEFPSRKSPEIPEKHLFSGVSGVGNPQMKVNNIKLNNTPPIESPSVKKTYGKDFKNVELTDDEYGKLVQRLGKDGAADYIERLSLWLAEGNKKKNHYATILNWWRKDGEKENKKVKTQKERSYSADNTEGKMFSN